MMPEQKEEDLPLPTTNADVLDAVADVLDAVKELTKTLAEVVESLNAMRDEYKLKTRAGVFDQTGVK